MTLGRGACWNVVQTHFLGLEPPRWDFTARTIFNSRVSAHTRELIGKYIYYFGVWEPNLTSWIRRRLAPGDVFIDIGANIGYYSLLAAKLVGDSGKVVAVEALPAIFTMLQHNLKLNHVRNVRAINCAAWDAEEEITIYTQPEDLPGLTTLMPDWAHRWHLEQKSRVNAAPLSAILKPDEFKAARLIKIDVEGAEWRVLCGMKRVMDSCRNDLEVMTEVSSKLLEAEGRTAQDVLRFFADYGFHAYSVENDYEGEGYLRREAPKKPTRIERILSEQADVIFSRIDADCL
ncbi:MAG TPA: FkbM family methyltransferase [Terriglobales bacterium]|nr:FkbM family methyltransferase [Terriglobales bacterium]